VKTTHMPAGCKRFGFGIPERDDHGRILTRRVINVKRDGSHPTQPDIAPEVPGIRDMSSWPPLNDSGLAGVLDLTRAPARHPYTCGARSTRAMRGPEPRSVSRELVRLTRIRRQQDGCAPPAPVAYREFGWLTRGREASGGKAGLLINFGAPTLREGLRKVVNGFPSSASSLLRVNQSVVEKAIRRR
jgi:hypothetical protein